MPDLNPSARPTLAEVLGARDRQAVEIEPWLAEVTPEQLAQTAPVPDDDRLPPYARGRRVRQSLGTVVNEEWAHHGFCVRDLDKLSGSEKFRRPTPRVEHRKRLTRGSGACGVPRSASCSPNRNFT